VYTQVTRLTRELAGTRPASPGHPYAKTREDPSMAFRFAGTRGHGSGSPASGLVTCPRTRKSTICVIQFVMNELLENVNWRLKTKLKTVVT
jgi:hypothetical protein